jgi:hypothetical protein
VPETHRGNARLCVGGAVDHRRRIEDDNVGIGAHANAPLVAKDRCALLQTLGGQQRHLSKRFHKR